MLYDNQQGLDSQELRKKVEMHTCTHNARSYVHMTVAESLWTLVTNKKMLQTNIVSRRV